jgi:4-coumarate--CoA ligase
MFSGYYNDPEATALCFDEKGWFRTGDVGFISADTKQWYIVGRKKEIFKVNSWAVGPAEIETHLTMHPYIADAAVAPIYPNGNQNIIAPKVKAFVITKPGANITEEQVLGYMSGRLAPHKTITGGVEFIESVPRNALGKIMRWKLVSENGDAATKES